MEREKEGIGYLNWKSEREKPETLRRGGGERLSFEI